LIPFVAAIERPDAPELQVRWPNNETIVITGNLKPGQIVSVQENAHPGWHAAVDGAARRVFADKLGLLTVVPECSGNCTIELHYDGGRKCAWRIGSIAPQLPDRCCGYCLVWATPAGSSPPLLPRRHQRA
jgi:hypothetical protein